MSLHVLVLVLVIVALVCSIASAVMARNSQPLLLLAVGVVLLAIVHLIGVGPILVR